jgi:type VI secretion system protein ImpJ
MQRTLDTLLTRQGLYPRTAARDVNEAVQRWLAGIIGSFVPRLADLVHQRDVHPLLAYRVLAELLGALSPFTRSGTYRIPPFQYDQLGPVFAAIFAGLTTALEAIGAEHHRQIPLVRFDAMTLFGDLNEPAIFRNEFFLRVTGADANELRTHVPHHFKIAAWADLGGVIRTATAGVPLHLDPQPPSTLPNGQGSVYFRLERGEAFTSIVKHGQVGIHHSVGLSVSDVCLFAVDPGAT